MTKDATKNAEHKLALARAYIQKKAPYLMATVYGMIPKPVIGIKTLAVTRGMVLMYEPDYVAAQTASRLGRRRRPRGASHLAQVARARSEGR
jgi:hypothetical protein